MSSIKDTKLGQEGSQEVDWAARQMKVLEDIKTEFSQSKPLEGLNIGACMHVTKETANLMLTLKAAGANVALCASNPLSTKDSVAAFLAESDVEVHAIHGVSNDDFLTSKKDSGILVPALLTKISSFFSLNIKDFIRLKLFTSQLNDM